MSTLIVIYFNPFWRYEFVFLPSALPVLFTETIQLPFESVSHVVSMFTSLQLCPSDMTSEICVNIGLFGVKALLEAILIYCLLINPLRAKFFWGNINIYLHIMPFLHIDMTQVAEILPQIRHGPTHFT